MATRIPQTPKGKLGEILCDADLFYLGGDDYEKKSELLFQEFKRTGAIKTYAEWELQQINFLSAHSFFTQTAVRERQKRKLEYLAQLLGRRSNLLTKSKKYSAKEIAEDIIFNVVGVIIASMALKFFLVPNQFFDGGITGLSLLVHEMYHINLSLLIIAFNIPLIIMGYYILGMHFSVRILISVFLFGMCLHFIPVMAVTQDKLLTATFGGVFLGLGVGLVMRAGAALDGMEVVALYTLKRTAFTITEIILGFNILIFSVAAFAFGIETALYSILTYFAATRTIDYVVEGIRAYMGVTIVSAKSEAIKYEIVNNMGRGITVYKGIRGFLPGNYTESSEAEIVFTIITRMEIRKLKNLVYEIDPKAFIFASTIKDASGGILTRRHVH
ncbi:MAG: YitT family protein [Chitinophagaceae bacterium]|nr:YitT family protein [Bacteroidota bacterium]MCC6257125.1 YitT family protein [Chitinophagaceae bacterium]